MSKFLLFNRNKNVSQIWKILADEMNIMSRKEHFWYWIFPSILLALLMIFFFSGIPVLIEMVNPKMVDPDANKEWGLLENIQLVVIAVIIGVSIYAVTKKNPILQRCGFGLVSVFAIFIFLEETDYGMHLIEYFTGIPGQSQLLKVAGIENIHNSYGIAKISKRIVYLFMMLLFIIAPLVKRDSQNKIISYLIPLPRIIVVATITILCELIARFLVIISNMKFEDLNMDVGEFSEILVYYVFLIYLWQLIFDKEWAPDK